MTPAARVACGVPQREPRRQSVGLERAAQLEKPVEVARNRAIPGGFDQAFAIHEAVCEEAYRQRDPAPVTRAIAFADVVPPAVFRAEIVGQLGDVEAALRITLRLIEQPHD